MRLAALKSKLPDEALALVARFDSHPCADMIRQITFQPIVPSEHTSAGLILNMENPYTFLHQVRELRRRLRHNRTRHVHGGIWLPAFFSTHSWVLTFDRWQYETVPELDYLPDWVRE